jgi:hydrogenase nickel incorporation protein HypB
MCGHCGCSQPSAPRLLELHTGLLSRNQQQAERNRAHFQAHGLLVVNLLSAPGSGKTAVLERLAGMWRQPPIGVIVGDLATDNDARRLQAAGARAQQIRTGDLCHLDADLVDGAFAQLDHHNLNLLVIENVGNLVCPAAFDLGEQLRLAVLSVTEGEDKPLKYPTLFRSADAVLINKLDLADAVGFQRSAALNHLQAIAPHARLFELSARTGQGFDALITWLEEQHPLAAHHGQRR